ncbi:Ficolin-2, partial [Lamellibrachia satsuma]
VYCDLETDGGGWIVIQRRNSGSVDFFRDWSDYSNGFGDYDGNFWIGLEVIRRLTSEYKCLLRIELKSQAGAHSFAEYSGFRVE